MRITRNIWSKNEFLVNNNTEKLYSRMDRGSFDVLWTDLANQSRSNNVVYVSDSFKDTFSMISLWIFIPEFEGFIDTGRCTAWHCSSEQTWNNESEILYY